MAQYILSKNANEKTARISIVKIPHPALNDVYTNVYFKDYVSKIIDESILPDMTYQESFCDFDNKGVIKINMNVAKSIKMREIRAARNKQLVALDKKAEAAYDSKDAAAQAAIEVQKQALRDLTKTIDLSKAETITDLQAIWPEGLPK